MIILGEQMMVRKRSYLVFIPLFLILNFWISTPNVSAPPPPSPDQFIAEIFLNSTAPLQLSYTNTIITFNNADLSNKIDIGFDTNYTIYNQENTTTLTVIQPISLAVNTSEITFEVFANNTPISHDLINVSPWNENITAIDIQLAWFVEIYPITLIRSNITLLKNSTSIIRYRYSFSNHNPFEIRDIFYLVYHLGTSQEWIGDTTGRVELRVYGNQPVFGTTGTGTIQSRVVDIIGGRSFICEWNNTVNLLVDIGARFYRGASPFVEMMEIIGFAFPISMTVAGIIIIVLIRSKDRKKREIT